MNIKAHTFFIIFLFFLLPSALLKAQEIEEIEDIEDSPYLWSYQMGDSNVDLYWDGYWKFNLSAGKALEIDDGETNWDSTYSDYTSGLYFLQTPDLLLSLWIDDRYYFETSVVEDYDYNTYLLGYKGADDEYLKSVKLGNTSIYTDSYATLSVTQPDFNTPGLSAKGSKEFMENEFMIRFDGTWEDSKLYIGSYEADEQYLELYDYKVGLSFVLPDISVDDLKVYVEDSDGSYSSDTSYDYDLVEEGDYLYDSDDGILTFTTEQTGRVAIYYEVDGTPIGDGSLGRDSVYSPTSTGSGIPDVDGATADFDFDLLTTDPYDTLGRDYVDSRQVTIDGDACLLIYEPGRFSPFALYNTYDYTLSTSSSSWLNEAHVTERYGTEEEEPDSFTYSFDTTEKDLELTRSDGDSRSALNRYPLGDILPGLYGNAAYSDTELVPYQLQLIAKTSKDSYTLGSSAVSSSVEVTINDSRVYNFSVDSDTGEVTFSRYIFPSDRIEITYRNESIDFEGQEMEIFQGNRFYLSERDTLEVAESFNWVFPDGEDSSTPDGGSAQVGLSWEHKGDSFNLSTEFTGSMDLGDADGIERVLGMEDSMSTYSIYSGNLAEPRAGEGEDENVSDGGNTFDSGNYVVLDDGDGPSSDDPDSDADFDTDVLVMTYDALSSAGDWTGADIILSGSGTADYSSLEEIRFYIRTSGTYGDLTFKIGEVGEYSDFDDSDVIDEYDEALVVNKTIDSTDLSSDWEQISLTISSDDRQMLTSTRAMRFIITYDDGWTSSGEIQIGNIELVGQTFSSSIVDDDVDTATIAITELEDDDLESAYDDEIDQFHSTGDTQRVSKMTWANMTDADAYWKATTWMDDKEMSQFQKVKFFVKTDSNATGGTYTVDLTDMDDVGIHLSWDASVEGEAWQMVTIDLAEQTATFDEGADSVSLEIDSSTEDLNKMVITGDSENGELSIDELYFEDSVIELGGSLVVDYDYETGEIITGENGFKYMANFFIDSRSTGSMSRQLSGLSQESESFYSQGETGIDLLYLGIELQADATLEESNFALWGGHHLTFPTATSPLTTEESFYLGDGDSTPSFSHSFEIDYRVMNIISGSLEHNSSQESDELDQTWEGDLQYKKDSLAIKGTADYAESSEEPLRGSAYSSSTVDNDYFSAWNDSWTYMIPDKDDITSRDISQTVSADLTRDRLSLEFDVSAETDTSYSSDWEQTDSLDWSLSVPWKISTDLGLTLTTTYSRSLSFTDDVDYSDSFATDLTNWADTIGANLPSAQYIPFWEVVGDSVSPDLPDEGEYSYTPAFSLDLSRNVGSKVYDLYVPSSVDLSFQRLYESESDSYYYQNTWSFSLRQRAMNLFGDFGVQPRFSFYNTDEFSNTLSLSFSEKNTTIPEADSLSWNCYNSFSGDNKSEFIVENDLSLEFQEIDLTENISLQFSWQEDRKPYRKILFTPYLIDTESYIKHSEECEYTLDESDSSLSHEVSAEHTSTLVIEKFGTVEGWIKLGYDWTDDVTTVGTEVGIEITMTF